MTTDPSPPPGPPVEPQPQPLAPAYAAPPTVPTVPTAGYQAQPYPYGYQLAPPTNGMAIASLVSSIALLLSCGPLSAVGAILGHIARRQIRERGESGDGLALAGILIGWIGLVVWLLAGAALVALVFNTGRTG